MTRTLPALFAAWLLVPTAAARAAPPQDPQQAPASGEAVQAGQPSSAGDVLDMGVSLARIRRELREAAPSTRPSVLRLDFHVDVYGKAPKIDILKGVDVSPKGAVRYGGMTHQEFLDLVTPRQFQMQNQPNFMGALQWLIDQLNKK